MVLPGLTAAAHRPHVLHGAERTWVEKNCYTDLWIELLHALGLDPHACLAGVFGLDFEGDQWTFFKPPLSELRTLYGIAVQELTVWRPLLDHALEHMGAGKWLAVEVDAFWLPDTAGTDYRGAHTKTTIVLNEVDIDARRLGYFHNAGYHVLEGEDFERLFAPTTLAPYAESIRIDRVVNREPEELRELSRRFFEDHLAWRPGSNPVLRFRDRFEVELPALRRSGLAHYHRWAFAGVRQWGAASELAALYLRWLQPDVPPWAAIDSFERIAQHGKTLILKAARAVNSGRALDARPMMDEMALAWKGGMSELASRQADPPSMGR
jgi:hypothetical protein